MPRISAVDSSFGSSPHSRHFNETPTTRYFRSFSSCPSPTNFLGSLKREPEGKNFVVLSPSMERNGIKGIKINKYLSDVADDCKDLNF